MSTITTGTTLTTAFVVTGDTSGELVVKTGAGGATALTLSATGNLSLATGNLTFSSTGQRITGDFSNATLSNRLAFQTSTTNGNTIVGAFPNGTGTNTRLQLFSASDPANASTASMEANATSSLVIINADKTGTGTYLPMTFYTGGSERMRITSGGDISVGRAASSSVRFFIQGANTGTDYALVCYNSSEQNLFYARNNGEITTGTAASSPYNNTTGSAANVFVTSAGILQRSTSSLRYKSDVTDAAHGLADVLKLRSVTYKGKNDGEKTFGGLIAEEVHDAGLTEFVVYDKEGRPDALHYGNMVALAFKAIQELKADNDALKARIAALEAK